MLVGLIVSLLHPSGIPHTDTLGIPPWVQWVLIVALAVIAIWMAFDLRAAHRQPERSEAMPVDGVTSSERLVAKVAIPEPKRRIAVEPSVARFRAGEVAPRATIAVSGLVFGWFAIDRARAVDSFASLIQSPGTNYAARLAIAIAALFWVGGALAFVSLPGAAIGFGSAGTIGFILVVADRWEARLELWGMSAAANRWSSLGTWSASAIAFAMLCVLEQWRLYRRRGGISRVVRNSAPRGN